jgi:aryl-alcohol dehydrogenase-like predicted oxidoreductase
VVERGLELGINYLDTAPLYGRSEALLGQVLDGERRPSYLATKVGFDPQGFDYRRDSVLWSLERSLKRLHLDRLTVAQIHEVDMAGWERITETGGALEGLRAAQARGLCDFIGITGRAIPLLARLAATGEFDTVLVYLDYHPCSREAAQEVIPAAAAQDMGIVIATALAGGLFVEGAPQRQALARISDAGERERALRVVDRLREMEGTLPQLAFRYVLADSRISTVASGASSPAELEEVAQAADAEPLDSEGIDAL